MTLPVAPSSISFSQLAAELGNACTNISLRDYSQCAALSSPDAISELYGKTCTIVYGTGTWSSGGNLTTPRYACGVGTQNAAILPGGYRSTPNSSTNVTEAYNGSSWAGRNAIGVSRYVMGTAGTQNEALIFGGYGAPFSPTHCSLFVSEAYNGSTWASRNNLNQARRTLTGVGTQNTALAVTGERLSPSELIVSCTEEYNGSTWTTSGVGTISIGSKNSAGAGIQNAALIFGGFNYSGNLSSSESYNGSNWSTTANLSTQRHGSGGAGTQNLALAFGGYSTPSPNLCSEAFNGSSWSTRSSMITARWSLGGAGTQNAALGFGGFTTPASVGCTESYSAPSCIRLC